jgi:hypothetical protein
MNHFDNHAHPGAIAWIDDRGRPHSGMAITYPPQWMVDEYTKSLIDKRLMIDDRQTRLKRLVDDYLNTDPMDPTATVAFILAADSLEPIPGDS